jgi:hypothetical protein
MSQFRKPLRVAEAARRNDAYFFQPAAMRFFDSYVDPSYIKYEPETASYLVVVSNQYRDLYDPAEDGDREYAVVRVKQPNGAASADYISDTRHATAQGAYAEANAA